MLAIFRNSFFISHNVYLAQVAKKAIQKALEIGVSEI